MNNDLKKDVQAIQGQSKKKASYNFKEVRIFTMPKGFKKSLPTSSDKDANSAKKTGFIVLLVGSLLLLASLAGAYYYFVINDTDTNTQTAQQNESNQEQKETEPKEKNIAKEEPASQETEEKTNSATQNNNQESEDNDAATENELEDSEANKGNTEEVPGQTEKEQTETKEETEEEQPEQEPAVLMVDNDQDGLSKPEEIVCGTDDNLPDTDGDGYNDLAEMLNGYNPVGAGSLLDGANFSLYENSSYNFSFAYPSSFQINAETNDSLILDLGNGEFFQLFVDDNQAKLDIEDWYKRQLGLNSINEEDRFSHKEWTGIKNPDNGSMYFKNSRDDYVIAFNYSKQQNSPYLNIFQVSFNSFEILE